MDELNDVLIFTENILNQIARFKGSALYIVLPVAILTTILVAGTLLACGGFTGRKIECVQTQIFLRLLMIISIVFWIIGSIFFVLALVNVGEYQIEFFRFGLEKLFHSPISPLLFLY